MARSKNAKKQTVEDNKKDESLWRKPITLDSFEDEDPLATLYQGREVKGQAKETGKSAQNRKTKISKPVAEKTKNVGKRKTQGNSKISDSQRMPKSKKFVNKKINKKSKSVSNTKVTEDELKNLLKIKSDTFQFTDIREILRGKSFDIYAYLCFLADNTGVCKIKHLDLMKVLNISRPTLFKQTDWLIQLALVDKSSVPGDHLGTSYRVYRLEEVLPISKLLIEQLQSHTKSFEQEIR